MVKLSTPVSGAEGKERPRAPVNFRQVLMHYVGSVIKSGGTALSVCDSGFVRFVNKVTCGTTFHL